MKYGYFLQNFTFTQNLFREILLILLPPVVQVTVKKKSNDSVAIITGVPIIVKVFPDPVWP